MDLAHVESLRELYYCHLPRQLDPPTCTLAVAWWGRRKMYRLFYLVHQLTLVTLLVGLVHAWSFWYFAAPGLCMWWVDRLMRMCREAEALTCREVTPIKGPRVTHVKVYAPELASRRPDGTRAPGASVSPTSHTLSLPTSRC